jgi:hypothetical protein
MDYLVPTAMETPAWETDKTITPSPHHPLGAKSVGESATVGAPPGDRQRRSRRPRPSRRPPHRHPHHPREGVDDPQGERRGRVMDFPTALLQLRPDTRTVQEVIDQLVPLGLQWQDEEEPRRNRALAPLYVNPTTREIWAVATVENWGSPRHEQNAGAPTAIWCTLAGRPRRTRPIRASRPSAPPAPPSTTPEAPSTSQKVNSGPASTTSRGARPRGWGRSQLS